MIPSMTKRATLAVVGQGYVGLPLALKAADCGYSVTGIEINRSKFTKLINGISYVEDVPSDRLKKFLDSGVYTPVDNFCSVKYASIVVVCVPTPIDNSNEPDLSILISAIKSVAYEIMPDSLLISESTSYPGTLRNIIKPTVDVESEFSDRILFAVAPERVDPGNINFSHENIPRLVSGLSHQASLKAKKFYESLGAPVVLTSTPEIAEASKLLENTFRQVNIALVNEFTQIMHKLRIDTREVIDAAATKPYGYMRFQPGPGVGGHCIPVDPHYLTWIARKNNFEPALISLANNVNENMPSYVVARLQNLLNRPLEGTEILVAGLAYKAGLSDYRESPSLKIISLLRRNGSNVSWCDPLVEEWENGPSSMDKSFDAVIITLPNLDLPMELWRSLGIKILDCTGTYGISPEIEQL
jgi:UDP-N-acetyl-D-glucosamine dehydrogenase